MQDLADQVLADERAVAVGGVDQVDAELWQLCQGLACRLGIGRVTPDALAGDAHGAEAEAIDLEVAADLERAARGCVDACHL